MTTKYGMFKENEYKLQGDAPSMEPRAKIVFDATGGGDREKGMSMKATVGKTGKGQDATFGKYLSLHEGDKYMDPARVAMQADAEKRKHNIVELPFKAAAPMKKSVGVGNYYGTIGGKVAHEPEHLQVPLQKGDVVEKPKGIYTSPAKKGTFGMNKFTLSERQGYKGVATEYEYQHDPVDVHKQKRMEALEAHHKACVTELPFKPANPAKKGTFGVPNTTISTGKGVAGEWEYVMSPPEEKQPRGEKEDIAAFKPSNAHVAKRINHIEYIHDPEAPKLQNARNKRLEESKRLEATGAWKPNMSHKTDMVRSVVKMNIPRCC